MPDQYAKFYHHQLLHWRENHNWTNKK